MGCPCLVEYGCAALSVDHCSISDWKGPLLIILLVLLFTKVAFAYCSISVIFTNHNVNMLYITDLILQLEVRCRLLTDFTIASVFY